jgi:hypothetical protein
MLYILSQWDMQAKVLIIIIKTSNKWSELLTEDETKIPLVQYYTKS